MKRTRKKITKPPDKIKLENITKNKSKNIFRCIKKTLKSIITDSQYKYFILDKLSTTVKDINIIITNATQFIKLYSLYLISKNIDVPVIDHEFINLCIRVVTNKKNSQGAKMKVEKEKLYEKLTEFYNSECINVFHGDKLTLTNYTQIVNYASTQIATAYEVNIKTHFFTRLFSYVNAMFDMYNVYNYEKITDKEELIKFKKQIRSELRLVKDDILNNTRTSDKKYHLWLDIYGKKLIPKNIEKSVAYDIKKNPFKYFPYMININKELNRMKEKEFECFPLRTSYVPKYITIDTAVLLELFAKEKNFTINNKMRDKIKENQDVIWNEIFNLQDKFFKKQKGYKFNHMIMTDGIGVTIYFVREDMHGKFIKTDKKKKDVIEFPYIDEIRDEDLAELLKEYKIVYVDPGKTNIIYCIDDNDNVYRYTRKQRLFETKRIRFQKIVKKVKKENNILEEESKLSATKRRTINYEEFKKYVTERQKLNNILLPVYEKEIFRDLKLTVKINTIRSEDNMINKIKEKYGEKIMIIYGDCNIGKQMRGIISTPMIGIKRLIAKEFPMLNIDEFRTSILDHRTEKKVKNAVVKTEKGNVKLHSVLVSEILNKKNTICKSYQSRDLNAVKNMRKLILNYIKNRTWLEKYTRTYKFPDESQGKLETDTRKQPTKLLTKENIMPSKENSKRK